MGYIGDSALLLCDGLYIFYRGVATKFLNRYNALFAISFRQN